MKRFLAWTLALVLALALAGCSGSSVLSKVQDIMQNADDKDDTPAVSTPATTAPAASTPAASTPAASAPAATAPAASTPAASSDEWIGDKTDSERNEQSYYAGGVGDHMRTVFFEFTINSVEYPEAYGDITPADGNQLILADVTVRNVFPQTLPMSIYDFQIQWGEGDEDFGYQKKGLVGDNLMPDQYQLLRGATETYKLLYEVPAPVDPAKLSISYLEVWDDNTEGDVFFVYFVE